MKKSYFLIFISLLFSLQVMAGKKTVIVSTSQPDAKIFVDGVLMGTGRVSVLVPKNSCVTVEAKKVGYLTYKISFCNKKTSATPPKTYYIEMERDDAYDASFQTDIANVDIEVKTNGKSEEEAWKLLSQIILSYFDVIEVTDRETGYLRTAWALKSFKQNTVRTRVIVKLARSHPLEYKVKLVSEASGHPGTSVKSDELFKEWDRVLRKYEGLISEIQSRFK